MKGFFIISENRHLENNEEEKNMNKKRVVIKIGSSSLTNEKGEIDHKKLGDHVNALAMLHQHNFEVILVSSGAVAAGFRNLGYSSRPVTLKGKQASAAIGQGLLIHTYMNKFMEYNIRSAQLLLTRTDFSIQKRYKNATSTMLELLERGVIPIINENDTVAVDELTFGDNDMLSALVSGAIHAAQLIILTDIDGIYDKHPGKYVSAKRYDTIDLITDEMIQETDVSGSKLGTGGMKSKLMAAKVATSLGVPVFIGKGEGISKLLEIVNGNGEGTYVKSVRSKQIPIRKQWISLHSTLEGKLLIDDGATQALMYNGSSLLSAGVVNIQGDFEDGDVVEVYNRSKLLGRGQVSCSSEELKAAKTLKKAKQVTQLSAIEVIHRDSWVMVDQIKEELL